MNQSSLSASQNASSMTAHTNAKLAAVRPSASQVHPAVPTATYAHMPIWSASKSAIAVLSFIVASGCETAPVKIDSVPEVPRATVAEVGVRERCAVKLPAEPAWLFTGAESSGLFDFYRRALAELEQRKQYELELKAETAQCQ